MKKREGPEYVDEGAKSPQVDVRLWCVESFHTYSSVCGCVQTVKENDEDQEDERRMGMTKLQGIEKPYDSWMKAPNGCQKLNVGRNGFGRGHRRMSRERRFLRANKGNRNGKGINVNNGKALNEEGEMETEFKRRYTEKEGKWELDHNGSIGSQMSVRDEIKDESLRRLGAQALPSQ
ncbi:unnamed protein product [Dovyalis caffra]|uniref:Uncharacterized protein n=1 Tax=Dovyalis caffra TaxID=77055 RepID=A0AAV1RDT4_9ROSI|nr:unnamed protein product [Dovyalis caffra]